MIPRAKPLPRASKPIRKRRSKPRRANVRNAAYIRWAHENRACLILCKWYEEAQGPTSCDGSRTFHHVRTNGSARRDDHGVILCQLHHHIQHGGAFSVEAGKKLFEKRYNVDLNAEAKAMYARYLEAKS